MNKYREVLDEATANMRNVYDDRQMLRPLKKLRRLFDELDKAIQTMQSTAQTEVDSYKRTYEETVNNIQRRMDDLSVYQKSATDLSKETVATLSKYQPPVDELLKKYTTHVNSLKENVRKSGPGHVLAAWVEELVSLTGGESQLKPTNDLLRECLELVKDEHIALEEAGHEANNYIKETFRPPAVTTLADTFDSLLSRVEKANSVGEVRDFAPQDLDNFCSELQNLSKLYLDVARERERGQEVDRTDGISRLPLPFAVEKELELFKAIEIQLTQMAAATSSSSSSSSKEEEKKIAEIRKEYEEETRKLQNQEEQLRKRVEYIETNMKSESDVWKAQKRLEDGRRKLRGPQISTVKHSADVTSLIKDLKRVTDGKQRRVDESNVPSVASVPWRHTSGGLNVHSEIKHGLKDNAATARSLSRTLRDAKAAYQQSRHKERLTVLYNQDFKNLVEHYQTLAEQNVKLLQRTRTEESLTQSVNRVEKLLKEVNGFMEAQQKLVNGLLTDLDKNHNARLTADKSRLLSHLENKKTHETSFHTSRYLRISNSLLAGEKIHEALTAYNKLIVLNKETAKELEATKTKLAKDEQDAREQAMRWKQQLDEANRTNDLLRNKDQENDKQLKSLIGHHTSALKTKDEDAATRDRRHKQDMEMLETTVKRYRHGQELIEKELEREKNKTQKLQQESQKALSRIQEQLAAAKEKLRHTKEQHDADIAKRETALEHACAKTAEQQQKYERVEKALTEERNKAQALENEINELRAKREVEEERLRGLEERHARKQKEMICFQKEIKDLENLTVGGCHTASKCVAASTAERRVALWKSADPPIRDASVTVWESIGRQRARLERSITDEKIKVESRVISSEQGQTSVEALEDIVTVVDAVCEQIRPPRPKRKHQDDEEDERRSAKRGRSWFRQVHNTSFLSLNFEGNKKWFEELFSQAYGDIPEVQAVHKAYSCRDASLEWHPNATDYQLSNALLTCAMSCVNDRSARVFVVLLGSRDSDFILGVGGKKTTPLSAFARGAFTLAMCSMVFIFASDTRVILVRPEEKTIRVIGNTTSGAISSRVYTYLGVKPEEYTISHVSVNFESVLHTSLFVFWKILQPDKIAEEEIETTNTETARCRQTIIDFIKKTILRQTLVRDCN